MTESAYAPNEYTDEEILEFMNKFKLGTEWETIGGCRCMIFNTGVAQSIILNKRDKNDRLLSDPISSFVALHLSEDPHSVWHRIDGKTRECNGCLDAKDYEAHNIVNKWI